MNCSAGVLTVGWHHHVGVQRFWHPVVGDLTAGFYAMELPADPGLTCHRRDVHAMGGMAAQIPIKGDPAANEAALAKVRPDKLREVKDGHDGTWVAHPALVPIAAAEFASVAPNQLSKMPEHVPGLDAMLELHQRPRTEARRASRQLKTTSPRRR